MSKIIFKQSQIPFFKKIIIDEQEILEQHNLLFAQGTIIEATIADIDGDPIIEYGSMFAYFNENIMEVLNEEQPRAAQCCGEQNVEEN